MKLDLMPRSCGIALAVMCAAAPNISQAQAVNWPLIESLRATRTFMSAGKDSADTPFRALIKDSAGVAAYVVSCHSGSYDGPSEINYSGDFQCAIFAVNGDVRTTGNLLAGNANEQSAEWWNRGRMRSAQLRGECLAFPEYSTVRHFKLRRMRITMRFSDIRWAARKDEEGSPRLGQFSFTMDVVPDNSARTKEAEPAAGPEPPPRCYP